MPKSDTRRMQPGDITEAVGLLTRLPVVSSGVRGARAAWAFPLAGALIAAISGAIGWFMFAIGLPAGLTGALVLAALIISTGAMHEDGLADCADGFWGGWDVSRRLEIMKDSQIGTYGVVALVLSLLARWSALVTLINAGWIVAPLIGAAVLSRAPMVAVMVWLEPARDNGLSKSVGRPDPEIAVLASIIALLVALVFTGFPAIPAALAAGFLGFVVALIAKTKIAGQTGDVLGATQQVAEIGVLAVLTALAG